MISALGSSTLASSVLGSSALASLALGSSGFLMVPVIAAVFLAKFSDQVFRFTFHNASIQLLWIPVKRTIKNRLKPVIEGSIRAGLEGVSGILIFLSITMFNVPIQCIDHSVMLDSPPLECWCLSSAKFAL